MATGITLAELRTQLAKSKTSTLRFGGTKGEDPNVFMNKMTLLILDKGLTTNDDKLKEYLKHLIGPALTWASIYFDDLFDATAGYQRKYQLADFLQSFKNTYAYQNLQEDARIQLDDLKQGNKSVGTYVQQFQTLQTLSGYTAAELLHRFLTGLSSGLRYDITMMGKDDNLENAINAAQKLERIKKGISRDPYTIPGTTEGRGPPLANTQYAPMDLDATKMRGQVHCYNCQQMGHIA